MGIADGSRVFLDTNCFIYYFEDNPTFADRLHILFSKIQSNQLHGAFSVITYSELLVKPKKEGNLFLENRYRLILMNYPNLRIVSVSSGIADNAASIRVKCNLKIPDAIILASALHFEADYIVTNDSKLSNASQQIGLSALNIMAL